MNHHILLDKLLLYDIRGVACHWLKDYLNNRQHFTQLNGFNLSYSNIRPLLFLIYINDMCDVSKILNFILFANDTKISSTHKNWNFIEKTLNEELSNLTDWCRSNKLSINIIKLNVIVFKPRQIRETLIFYSHSVGGYYRRRLENFTFLKFSFLLFLEIQNPSASPPPSKYTSVTFLFFK